MRFDCGCKFDSFDWDEILEKENCPAVWEMIGQGLTKGVFQLEGSLGRAWSKRVAPRSVEELSDVISLIRPGCLEAEYREDPATGKMLSIADTYLKVRNEELTAEYIDPSLEPILKNTYGVPIYQEQIMKICENFAGFNLTEADKMRKAVGKKDDELMLKLKGDFIEKAKECGREESVADTVFSWINKFAGYGFNKSHGVGYAAISYMTAYAKIHFPLEFFKAMLSFSDSKQDEFDEKKQLVHEARLFGITVVPPSVERGNADFELDGNKLYYGLSHVKGIGSSAVESLVALKNLNSANDLFMRLFNDGVKINKSVMEALFKAGAFDYLGENRIRLLGRYQFMNLLTDREKAFALKLLIDDKLSVDNCLNVLIEAGIPRGKDAAGIERSIRIKDSWGLIKKELGGNRKRMALAYERFLLGMPISGSETELYNNPKVDTTCRDFLRLRNNTKICMGVVIEDVYRFKDKNKNDMCFLKISDATYLLEKVVVFASVYHKVAWIIEEGKAVLIKGKKKNESFLIDFIEHL